MPEETAELEGYPITHYDIGSNLRALIGMLEDPSVNFVPNRLVIKGSVYYLCDVERELCLDLSSEGNVIVSSNIGNEACSFALKTIIGKYSIKGVIEELNELRKLLA
jgi:hypothetical protein